MTALITRTPIVAQLESDVIKCSLVRSRESVRRFVLVSRNFCQTNDFHVQTDTQRHEGQNCTVV